MEISYYPDTFNRQDSVGSIKRFFKDLEDDPQLLTMVREIYKKVRKASDLSLFERQGIVERLPYSQERIYEFRIPPGGRSAGVARLYFGYKRKNSSAIVILNAEIKHGRIKADQDKIKEAEKRYRKVCR
jgi:hypothetical protein